MDLRALRHFATLARRQSFVAAAEELNLTQPALSRSIRTLEEELGLRLVERHRSGCSLTAAGALLMRDATAILAQAAALRHNMQAHARGDLGHIRFGAAPLPAALLLPDLLAAAARELPGLTLAAMVRGAVDLAAQLRRDAIEFFFCAEVQAPRDPMLERDALGEAPLAWLVRADHPLAGRGPVALDDLRAFPLASVGADFGVAQEGAPDMLLGMPVTIRCDDYAVLIATIARCDAVCLSSPALIGPGDRVRSLQVFDDGLPATTPFVLVRRVGRSLSRPAQSLLDHARTISAAMGARLNVAGDTTGRETPSHHSAQSRPIRNAHPL
ncbi:LysR family transcriptional regulator [Flavisphingomonas formosensis]|uniref:LysR family transcriptional regulator n=1 Tax=Flavisphingomonas formosensis TaxID=861534 RepID=UPI0018DFDA30|nr:LysR family transcriptional regulator [Sphingomonas formosensis]